MQASTEWLNRGPPRLRFVTLTKQRQGQIAGSVYRQYRASGAGF